ncbi:hypothetical protein [Epibacterium ulvae]|uniref:hypothetical protein n=1 Tax=Epibacterium ulvae TaxID=1156985 RepID=UPI002492F2AB|nr:hypothetical protein [Epibacterium ulvae]
MMKIKFLKTKQVGVKQSQTAKGASKSVPNTFKAGDVVDGESLPEGWAQNLLDLKIAEKASDK